MHLRRITIAGLSAITALAAQAEERLPMITPAQYTTEQKQVAKDFEASRKVPVFGPFEPLMHSPQVMSQARAMGDYLRYKSAIGNRVRAQHFVEGYPGQGPSLHGGIATLAIPARTTSRHGPHPQSTPPACFGGHFTVPYEQNTQQSPGFGFSRIPQRVHS